MLAIQSKRDGKALDEDTINAVVEGITDMGMPDSQVAAFAMATFLNGMDARETAVLTRAMAHSGEVLAWDEQDLGGPVVDKHSTGGVGDMVSLLLAPIVAACGGFVPMVSGRGLGHTGGSLDKLEAVPGYKAEVPAEVFQKTVKEVGCAIVGATEALAPADKRLYSIRDVTATVASIPLITGSILSKKMAAGIHKLVMDIKTGNGAFMSQMEDARDLAQMIVNTGKNAGMDVIALITDMDEPLGETAGNALEVAEVADILAHRTPGDRRLLEVTYEFAAEMLVAANLAAGLEQGRQAARDSVSSGAAATKLSEMMESLGADPGFMDDPQGKLPTAKVSIEVRPSEPGHVTSIRTLDLGMAVVELGGGRKVPGEDIDHSVGLSAIAKRGSAVGPKDSDPPLLVVHARDEDNAQVAAKKVLDAFAISQDPPKLASPLLEKVS